jgi:hypothetical protein
LKTAKLAIAGTTLCALLIVGGAAHAGDHDGGVVIRAAAGINNGSSQLENQMTGTIEYSGLGLDFEAAGGWVFARNLAVHATTFGWRVYDPAIGRVGGKADGHVTLGALGAGLTYYIMPVNIYFTTSFAAAKMRFWVDGDWWESNTGLAFEFMVGKEWFLGGGLGIGGMVGVMYHTIPDSRVDARWTGAYLPLLFSATFN